MSSAGAGGLNTTYHYWVEVPPGLTHLVVDIFDPDIGIGGAAEATAGRDRARNTFDSSASYSIFNPSGQARTTSFTTGDATNPAGGDNAWVTLFDTTGDYVRDNFTTVAYTNNDGLVNWGGNWIETNDDNNANNGNVRITGGELRIRDDGNANNSMIERQADLSTFSSASFSFDVRATGLESGDQFRVEVSSNGGASWTTLETFTGNLAATTRTYDISAFRATNTRIRFATVGTGFSGNSDEVFFDNVQIIDGTVKAGHWEVRVDMSSAVTAGDDINAIGIRAHDGTSGSGGTELNVYVDNQIPLGANPPNSGTQSRSYTLYPFITSGCTCQHNDFDVDTNSGATSSANYQTQGGAGSFTQNFTQATMSGNDVWNRDAISGWTTDSTAVDYGIWSLSASISSYLVAGAPNGNYATFWDANYAAAANPPTANPATNGFRIYMPTDAGAAPVKPIFEQRLTQRFPGTLTVGVPRWYTITLAIVNNTSQAITFSSTNLVRANIPGSGVVYAGNASTSQGSITANPAIGGTGAWTWNPGTVAAGATALGFYDVTVTPTSAGQRLPVTSTPASGNGTRATYVDETGNTTQTRATYTFGPLCELAATEGLATEVLISAFDVAVRGNKTFVEWTTASEAGTIGFNVLRVDRATGALVRVNDRLLPANVGAPQGGRYRFVDSKNSDPAPSYAIEEVTANGKKNVYGPYFGRGNATSPDNGASFDREPRKGKKNEKVSSGSSKKSKPDAVMVGVNATGIVRVAAADLAAALGQNVNPVKNSIDKGKVSVTSRGAQVGWTSVSNGDALLFFGEKSDSIYSNDRVYRIELTKDGTTMPVTRVASATAATSTFQSTKDAEVDAFAATVLPLDPAGDYWFWDFVLSGDPTYGRKELTVDAPAVAGTSNVTLQVRLQGAMSDTAHRARVSLNGVTLGDVTWSSLDGKSADLAVPAAVLRDGANTVAVEGILEGGAGFDVFYIDGFQLRYDRFARPDDGRLEIGGANGRAIGAGPFASAPMILDVTNRLRPSLLDGAVVSGGNASFVAPAGASTLFLSDSAAFLAPSLLRGSETGTTRSNQSADYLIIVPPGLRDSAAALAQLREREGLRTLIVDLDQIADDFAGGNSTPLAIRDFIASTARWSRAPRYVVLVGAGSLDYRGLMVDPGLMPPLMTKTADGLYAADSLFADRNGDGLPDVAIGRIPVNSAAELDAYVAKLDASARVSVARSPLVFSADGVDRGADFKSASQQVEVPLLSRPATRVYLDDLGGDAGRNAFLGAWRSGTPLVSWLGHGAVDRISNASVLTVDDVPSLSSSGALPMLVAMTCTINRFELGDFEALGAALTRMPAAGAVAVWSASGLSVHAKATDLERTFTRLAAKTPGSRIGDLIVQSLQANRTAIGETGGVYLLLGDPAIRLTLPGEAAPPAGPTRSGE